MKLNALFLATIISIINITAQEIPDMLKKSLQPISPTAYQFLKFGEIPINEYTGSPNIEIPLFNVDIRGFSLPVKLQYHSKGIRLNEEADWVGLGWDLSFGSVTQIVNDKNDLGIEYSKKYLPYFSARNPITYPFENTKAPDSTNMSINNDSPTDDISDVTYSFLTIEHGIHKGDGWDVYGLIYFDDIYSKDFEKDIFIANVLGEQLYILVKPVFSNNILQSTTSYTVLNKKGYQVSIDPTSLAWKIINPSGVICYFEEKNLISSNSSSTSNTGYIGVSTTTPSYIWQITKIVSVYGDTIKFAYSTPNTLISNILSYSWNIGSSTRTTPVNWCEKNSFSGDFGPLYLSRPPYIPNNAGPIDYRATNSSSSTQYRTYLKSISYNQNTITFNTSARSDSDWVHAQKLDKIVINNSVQQTIKNINFKYHYYLSSSDKRLRLDTLINQDDKYVLTYNPTPLPPRNSLAVDYWGYYNGQLNNKTAYPNPIDFKDRYSYDSSYESRFKDQCGVLYAVNDFCKAGILEKIQYPTGGYSKFCYSLNFFDNCKVPNDPSITNTSYYYGNGLKVDSIINYNNTGDIATIKYFQYEGGKLQTPLHLFYNKSEVYCEKTSYLLGGGSGEYATYTCFRYEANTFNICSTNYFSPNPTGDGTGVGYNKVTTRTVNANVRTVDNGKTIHYYTNNPDVFYSGNMDLIEMVPTYHKGFNNGTLLRESIYDNANNIKSNSVFNYTLSYDQPIEYNCRPTFKGQWELGYDLSKKEMLLVYYPIYKPETILTNKQSVSYYNNDSVVSKESYFYNKYNLVNYKEEICSAVNRNKEDTYLFPYDISDNNQYDQRQINIMQKLVTQNRLDEKIKIQNSMRTNGTLTTKTQYVEYNDTVCLPWILKTSLGESNPLETELIYKYDSKKNIIQSQGKDNIPTTYLWGYNNQYPIAEIKNATYAQVTSALGVDPLTITLTSTPDMTKINGLRSSLPNAQVATFTYKPLVGISTITDPRGVTTNYTYDTFNRLYLTRNDDKNIVGLNRYAYQNNPDNGLGGYSAIGTPIITANDTVALNVNYSASISVSGGSGNFTYNWHLGNSSGAILTGSINNDTTSQCTFASPQKGTVTLQCIITDTQLGLSKTISKSIICVPIQAKIITDSDNYFYTATGNASINPIGGSGTYYEMWYLKDVSNNILYRGPRNFTVSNWSFPCTQTGPLTVLCVVKDQASSDSLTVTKNVMCAYAPFVVGQIQPNASGYVYNSIGTATISVSGGSRNYSYIWSLMNNNGVPLPQTSYTTPTFNFKCTQTGTLTLQCTVADPKTGGSSTVRKSITVN